MKEYKVSGMSCTHCESTVRNIALKHGAGADAIVNHKTGQVRFAASDKFDEKRFMDDIEDAGYEVEPVADPQTLADVPKETGNRSW